MSFYLLGPLLELQQDLIFFQRFSQLTPQNNNNNSVGAIGPTQKYVSPPLLSHNPSVATNPT